MRIPIRESDALTEMRKKPPGRTALGFCGLAPVLPLGGRMPTAALRASMARSASGSLRDRRTGRWHLSRLASTRAQTLAALVYAASEPSPPRRHAELTRPRASNHTLGYKGSLHLL